mmetsp:Transcript_59079/g.139072  ORF Transcript_59079/g.139072 Transcript_59079/m.139072 type:complete len:228 (-) Transcript_59079:165-848(-)
MSMSMSMSGLGSWSGSGSMMEDEMMPPSQSMLPPQRRMGRSEAHDESMSSMSESMSMSGSGSMSGSAIPPTDGHKCACFHDRMGEVQCMWPQCSIKPDWKWIIHQAKEGRAFRAGLGPSEEGPYSTYVCMQDWDVYEMNVCGVTPGYLACFRYNRETRELDYYGMDMDLLLTPREPVGPPPRPPPTSGSMSGSMSGSSSMSMSTSTSMSMSMSGGGSASGNPVILSR